jgi:hypothetical protein
MRLFILRGLILLTFLADIVIILKKFQPISTKIRHQSPNNIE